MTTEIFKWSEVEQACQPSLFLRYSLYSYFIALEIDR
jgi:hypothetical protein